MNRQWTFKLLTLSLGLLVMFVLLNLDLFIVNNSMWFYMTHIFLMMADLVFVMGMLFLIVFDYLKKYHE